MLRWILFLGVYYQMQWGTYTCCPKCMRKHILVHGFTYNILTGNFMWLFLALPWNLVLLIMSCTRGHSKAVRKMIVRDDS